jgi:hypothetical protein
VRRLGSGRAPSAAGLTLARRAADPSDSGQDAGLLLAGRTADPVAAASSDDDRTPTEPPRSRSRRPVVVGLLAVAVIIVVLATVLPNDARYAFLDLRHDAHFVMRPLRSDSYSFSADGVSFAAAIIIEMIGTSMLIMIVIGWLEQRRRRHVPSRSVGGAIPSRSHDRGRPARDDGRAVQSRSHRHAVPAREPPSRGR